MVPICRQTGQLLACVAMQAKKGGPCGRCGFSRSCMKGVAGMVVFLTREGILIACLKELRRGKSDHDKENGGFDCGAVRSFPAQHI